MDKAIAGIRIGGSARKWRAREWAVIGLCVLAVAIAAAVVLIARSPAPADPSISWSGEGATEGVMIYRDADGAVVAVTVAYVSTDITPAFCELEVGGEVRRDTAVGGMPAVCVWAAGVSWDGAPGAPRATLN